MRILAVDDNRDNLVALRAVIHDALPGAEVLTAANGPDGIELARIEDPDVILLDIVMPGVDGFEVCRRLKADDALKDTPVVFLTAQRSDAASRVEALEIGAEGFLTKPLDPIELTAQIRAMVKVKAAARLRRTEKERLETLVRNRTRDLERNLSEVRRLADEWQSTFDSVKDVVWILDEDMRVIRSNRAAETVFGRGLGQIIGKRCWEVVHGGPAPSEKCPMVEMFRSLQRESEELQVGDRWMEVTVDPIVGAAGDLLGSVHIISDITARKLTEARLNASELRFRSVFESANVGKSITLLTGEINVNEAFCRMLGYTAEELRGKKWQDLTPWDDIARTEDHLRPLLDGSLQSTRLNKRYIRKDGSTIWCDASIAIHRDGKGNSLHYITTVVDITERLRAEEAIAMQARRSAVLLEIPGAADSLTETGFLQWGLERAEELIDSETGLIRSLAADDQTPEPNEWQGACAETARLRKPVVHNGGVTDAEEHGFANDRAALSRLICVPVIENGQVAMLVGVGNKATDYTDLDVESLQLVANEVWRAVLHRRAEIALERSEESYRRLTEQLPVIIYRAAADLPSTTTYISQAVQMLGFTPAEWLSEPTYWFDNLHPEDRPRVLAALKALHEGKGFSEEYRLKDRAGNWRHFRDQAVVLSDPSEQAPYIQGVMIDITERERAQARTRQALDLATRRRKELEGLLEASRAIQEHADFLGAGRRIFEIAKQLLGASSGFVALRSKDGDESVPVLDDLGPTPSAGDDARLMPNVGALRQAYESGKPVLDNDVRENSYFDHLPEGHSALESLLIVPLNLDGEAAGLLGLGNKPGGFADADIELASAFGDLAALALKNAREMDLRKKAEESQRLSERRYRELFENPFTGVTVYEAVDGDADFLVREFNEAGARMTGDTKESVLGRRATEAFPGIAEMGLLDVLRRVYRTGEAVHYPPALYVGADGVSRWYENHVHRLPSGEIVALFEDVTTQHEAEIDLRDSRERYALLFDTSNDAIFVHTMDNETPGKFIEVNEVACLRLGYSRDELLRMSPQDVDAAETDGTLRQATEKLVHQGQVVFETVQVSKTGEKLPVEISTRLFSYKGERLALSVNRDIRERKLAEAAREALQAQLVQAQKMESVGRLAGGVAHDFNNMLSIILGYGESIFDGLHPGDPLREQVKQILDAANRSADLTRQLLAFSRKQTLQPEVLDLNDIVRGMEKMLRRLIGEHIELQLSLSDEIGKVLVDPGQMEQVMMNLVVNARDAMPKSGELLLRTSATDFDQAFADSHPGTTAGRHVVLAVTDTGCGMSDALISRIFEPFFTTKEMGEGTGLGLSTVYGIVKQSGGSIWVHSQPGQGTTFEVCLPQTEAEEGPRRSRADEQRRTKGGEHVLIVEDEEGLRKLMETLLPRLGYQVTTAANGGEGLLLIEERGLQPQLIITDVVMPNMSGKELVSRLRKSHPELKVLYMSGYTDDAIARHGVLEPNTPFLQKPFTINDIAAKIRAVLDEH